MDLKKQVFEDQPFISFEFSIRGKVVREEEPYEIDKLKVPRCPGEYSVESFKWTGGKQPVSPMPADEGCAGFQDENPAIAWQCFANGPDPSEFEVFVGPGTYPATIGSFVVIPGMLHIFESSRSGKTRFVASVPHRLLAVSIVKQLIRDKKCPVVISSFDDHAGCEWATEIVSIDKSIASQMVGGVR